MGDLLIRNVPERIAARLRAKAKESGRSIAAEALEAIDHSLTPSGTAAHEMLVQLRAAGLLNAFNMEASLRALRDDRAR